MDDLKIIKNKYGEKMMHLCKELFPTILETPGKLSNLMLEHFEPSKFLYADLVSNIEIESFRDYIEGLIEQKEEKIIVTSKTPQELLSDAGYILYECQTEEDIQSFKKYYAPSEKLCTFNGQRLNYCYVFFAVKKNVDEIKRENFPNPKREDEYGTSVISIQFRKQKVNTISIKNRYNHVVLNPDNTFYNNLDNIIPGLNESFKRKYNLNFTPGSEKLELQGYVCVEGKYYKYNYEINNIYYCPNNIIINNFNVIDKYSKEPERYIILDYFIIDLKEKTIKLYDKIINDSFIDSFKNIKKITITKDKNTKEKNIEIINDNNEKAIITINNKNQIISYYNEYLIEMGNEFLSHNRSLITFSAPNLKKMDDYCLAIAPTLTTFSAKNLIKMGSKCLYLASKLTTLEVPNLTEMGENCLYSVSSLKSFKAEKLTEMRNGCLGVVSKLMTIEVPNLTKIGKCCLEIAMDLTTFKAENLIQMDNECLGNVPNLKTFSAENLKEMGEGCLRTVSKLITFDAENLIIMGDNCLYSAELLTTFKAENLTQIGKYCLQSTPNLTTFIVPNSIKEQYFKEYLLKNKDTNSPQLSPQHDTLYQQPITKIKKTPETLSNNLNATITNTTYNFKEPEVTIELQKGTSHNK